MQYGAAPHGAIYIIMRSAGPAAMIVRAGCRGRKPWLARSQLDSTVDNLLTEDVERCRGQKNVDLYCSSFNLGPGLETVPYLEPIVSWIAQMSCGYGFLLQPRIVDFELAEYR